MNHKYKKISTREAEILLEKYYQGNTSCLEEKQLHDFLSQGDLPDKFNADRMLFRYFLSHKKPSRPVFIPFLRWTGVAAIFIGALLIARPWEYGIPDNVAYINGQKYTDTQMIKEQALLSIQSISSLDEVKECTKDLNDRDLIESQLEIFSSIQN